MSEQENENWQANNRKCEDLQTHKLAVKKSVEKNLALRLLQLIFSQRQYFAEVLLHINLRGGLYLLKAGIRDE